MVKLKFKGSPVFWNNMVCDMDIFKRIINFYFCSWATDPQYTHGYTSSFKGGLNSSTTEKTNAGFHMGGPPTFFSWVSSKNINARIEDRSCGEWKQKKKRYIEL